jgi:hypothetical protein
VANVIISRIQNRRGLKQDLPQPLRPGELGFAVDSKQLFIGADPDDIFSGAYNKISTFESTANSKSITLGIANNNIIAFTVPYKKFPAGYFDGVARSASWTLTSNTFLNSGQTVFGANSTVIANAYPVANVTSSTIELSSLNTSISVGDRVQGADIPGIVSVQSVGTANSNTVVTLTSAQTVTTANLLSFVPNNIVSITSNTAFTATDITVVKNGSALLGDAGNATPSPAKDYSFAANTLSTNAHVLSFRTTPSASDEIAVSYYSNASVIRALSNATTIAEGITFPGTIFTGTNRLSFYEEYNIPSYRQIPESFVTVSPSTGTGLIGLQQKHIAVTADSVSAINDPQNLTLGNLLVSRSSEKISAPVAISTAMVFTVGAGHPYTLGGPYNYIYVNNSGNYLDNKVFKVTGTANTTITVALPANAAQTGRNITANVMGSFGANANLKLTGNVSGVSVNDFVYFSDSNVGSNIDGKTLRISSVDLNNSTFNVFTGTNVTINANITSNLRYINWGSSNIGSNVQIFSPMHGFSNGDTILVSDSSFTPDIAETTYTVASSAQNTFFITPTSAVTANVTLDVGPNLASSYANTFVTPIRSIDLSEQTTLADVCATVNDIGDFPQMNQTPETADSVYFTHKEAFSSVGLEFGLHEDLVTPTLGVLRLTPGLYTKDSTVKAKLEKWLNSLLEAEDVNLFSSVKVGEVYTSTPALVRSVGTYTLNVDNTFDEITFDHRDEVRDFNSIVNNVYFERSSNDIRGLVNVKTNIELQTRTAAVIGDKTVSYTDLNTAAITNSAANAIITGLQQSIDVYDSYVLEYTITEAATETSKYQRMGHLMITGRSDFNSGTGAVLFQDIASEMTDTGVTGNVVLEAHMGGSNTTINIHATNNLSPATDLEVKYTVRRWSSLPG